MKETNMKPTTNEIWVWYRKGSTYCRWSLEKPKWLESRERWWALRSSLMCFAEASVLLGISEDEIHELTWPVALSNTTRFVMV